MKNGSSSRRRVKSRTRGRSRHSSDGSGLWRCMPCGTRNTGPGWRRLAGGAWRRRFTTRVCP